MYLNNLALDLNIFQKIGFIDFMLKDESFQNYTNLFSLNEYEKKYKIMLKYFH